MAAKFNLDEVHNLLENLRSARLTPLDAISQFEVWMQAVDRNLQAAAGELRPAGPEWDQVRDQIEDLGRLLSSCTSPDQFRQLEEKLAQLEASRASLEAAWEAPVEAEPEEAGPLPERVRDCLDHMQAGLSFLVEYAETRDRQDLERLAAEIEQAGQAVREFLNQND